MDTSNIWEDDETVLGGGRKRARRERQESTQLFQCSECDMNFEHESYLADHWLTTHLDSMDGPAPPPKRGGGGTRDSPRQQNRCNLCPRSFQTWEDLRAHQETAHEEGELRCRTCRRVFRTPGELEQHEASHRKFECGWCKKSFTISANLRAHERIHTGERPYKCADCPKSFKQLGGLQYHLRANPSHRAQKDNTSEETHTRGGEPSSSRMAVLMECGYPNCNRKFTSEKLLNRHIRNAHEEKEERKSGSGGFTVTPSSSEPYPHSGGDDDVEFEFEGFEEEPNEEVEPNQVEAESDVVLCMICCFSFYRDAEARPENLQINCQFDQFINEVLRGQVEGRSCSDLFSSYRNLSICSDCRILIGTAMKQRQKVVDTGRRVRRKEEDSTALGERLAEYAEEMRRIEGVVSGGDVPCLEVHLERAERALGRRAGGGGSCWVRLLRDGITTLAEKLEKSGEKLMLNRGNGSVQEQQGKTYSEVTDKNEAWCGKLDSI